MQQGINISMPVWKPFHGQIVMSKTTFFLAPRPILIDLGLVQVLYNPELFFCRTEMKEGGMT